MARKHKTYPAYKDSGVDWLGDIPEGWKLKRLGSLFQERKEKVNDRDFPPLSVTKQGIVPQLETAAKTDAGDNRKGVYIGDIAINSRSDRKGSCGLSELEGSVSLINIVLKPSKDIHSWFAHHLLRSYAFQEEFYRWGSGIVDDLWTTRYSEMKNISVATPPLAEQQAIADFLDAKGEQINSLIEKKQKQIELLQEKRIALITQAVTKGLNPKIKMKPSGIAWLGDIPKHWDFKRLRFCAFVNPSSSELKFPKETPVSFVPMEAIHENGTIALGLEKPIQEVSKGYTYFSENDVIVAKITPCFENGKGALAKGLKNKVAFGTTELHVLRPFPVLLPRYLFLLTVSSIFRILGEETMYGSAGQKRVPENFVKDFLTTLPPVEEQQSIADFLDKETAKIDTLIGRVEDSITLLREYRTVLITAAVTGTIDVRQT